MAPASRVPTRANDYQTRNQRHATAIQTLDGVIFLGVSSPLLTRSEGNACVCGGRLRPLQYLLKMHENSSAKEDDHEQRVKRDDHQRTFGEGSNYLRRLS